MRLRRLVLLALLACAAAALPVAPADAALNDFGCRPSAERPFPVVLVHGTFADSQYSWNRIAPQLEADGFCVFALDYGNRARAPYDESADQIAAFTRRVLDSTGARKVSFVGHSQGGSISRYVAKFRGLLDRTDEVVGLVPSSHGTEQPLTPVAAAGFDCRSCSDQMAGSPIMRKLNAPPEAPEEADWTVVSTRYDTVVIPVESQFLAGATVTNVLTQDKCAQNTGDHTTFVYDLVAIQWMRNALLRAGPANPAFEPDCSGLTLGRDPSPRPISLKAGGASGGGSGSSTSGTAAPVRPAPAARAPRSVLEFRGSRVRVRRGRLLVPLRCRGSRAARCVGEVRISAGRRTIAAGPVVLEGGRSRTARLRLRRGATRYLRTHRRAVLSARARTQGVPVRTARGRYRVRRF